MDQEIQAKYLVLQNIIKDYGQVLVAFSGGTDSTTLAKIAYDTLGSSAIAITGESETLKEKELLHAKILAKEIGISHQIIKTDELRKESFASNPSNRCYYCKHELFSKLIERARANKIPHIIEGSNVDDLSDYRPGYKAAQEFNIKSPFLEAKLNKSEIRHLAKSLGISNWNKAAEPCLSSRIPYGTSIDLNNLRKIEAAEAFLDEIGFGYRRVRFHETIARIEVNETDFLTLLKHREVICKRFKELGFLYTTLDLKGYRMGSMNETL